MKSSLEIAQDAVLKPIEDIAEEVGLQEEEFEPYGVGYIELPGQVVVEARLTESDPDQLAIGSPMELVIVPFRHDDDGNEVVTFAFRPVADGSLS